MQIARQLLATSFIVVLSITGAAAQSTAQHVVPQRAYAHTAQRPARPQHQRPMIFHHPSVQQAWQTAAARRRPLVVMFTSDSCHYCTKMLRDTYSHPAIQQMLAANSETVLAPAKSNRALSERLGVRAYPTTLVVSPEGKIVASIEGFIEPRAFAQRIAPLLIPAQPGPKPSSASRQVAATHANR